MIRPVPYIEQILMFSTTHYVCKICQYLFNNSLTKSFDSIVSVTLMYLYVWCHTYLYIHYTNKHFNLMIFAWHFLKRCIRIYNS